MSVQLIAVPNAMDVQLCTNQPRKPVQRPLHFDDLKLYKLNEMIKLLFKNLKSYLVFGRCSEV